MPRFQVHSLQQKLCPRFDHSWLKPSFDGGNGNSERTLFQIWEHQALRWSKDMPNLQVSDRAEDQAVRSQDGWERKGGTEKGKWQTPASTPCQSQLYHKDCETRDVDHTSKQRQPKSNTAGTTLSSTSSRTRWLRFKGERSCGEPRMFSGARCIFE
jgi:hypothetical protein